MMMQRVLISVSCFLLGYMFAFSGVHATMAKAFRTLRENIRDSY